MLWRVARTVERMKLKERRSVFPMIAPTGGCVASRRAAPPVFAPH